jgi:4-hydroxy-tetrahydrodipicolinate reductase
MTQRVLVVGAGGRMGDALVRALAARRAATSAGGTRGIRASAPSSPPRSSLPIRTRPARTPRRGRLLLESTLALLDVAEARGMPLVIGTTGLRAAGTRIARAAERVPRGAGRGHIDQNHPLTRRQALPARGLPDRWLEMHRPKQNAPSGTALALARAAAAARGQELQHVAVYAREGITGKRDPHAIGLQALRLSDSVGEHTVYFGGPGERVELAHRAFSRDNFAAGALRAARC